MASIGSSRIETLDALRVVAAVLVIVQHVSTVIARHPDAPAAFEALVHAYNYEYLSPGRVGVVAFFLISGFLIPFTFRGASPLSAFLFSRIRRIYPAYWFSMAIIVMAGIAGLRESITLSDIIVNATLMQTLAGVPDMNPAYWTLFLELVFYGFCIVAYCFNLLRNRRFLVWMIVFFMSAALGSAYLRYADITEAIPVGYFNFFALMWLGACYRLSHDQTGGMWTSHSVIGTSLVAILTPALTYLAYAHQPEIESWVANTTSIYVAIGLFLAFVGTSRRVNETWLFMGSISYGIYLFFDIPLDYFGTLLYQYAWWMSLVLLPIIVSAITLLLAYLSYVLIERPINRWRFEEFQQRFPFIQRSLDGIGQIVHDRFKAVR